MPIWKVIPSRPYSITAGRVNDLRIRLTLKINDKGQSVQGSGLWKVSMWGSGNINGSGDRISYEEQVIVLRNIHMTYRILQIERN